MYLIVIYLVFSHLGFWNGNFSLIVPFPDHCLLLPFYSGLCSCHRVSFVTSLLLRVSMLLLMLTTNISALDRNSTIMSPLVGKPTMWFPNMVDTNRPVQSQKRARSLKFRIYKVKELYYPCSENKGADQLRGYREADLRLCFRICRLLVFPWGGSIIVKSMTQQCFNKYLTLQMRPFAISLSLLTFTLSF